MSDSFSIPKEAGSMESNDFDNSSEDFQDDTLAQKPSATNFDFSKPKFVKDVRHQSLKPSTPKIDRFPYPKLSILQNVDQQNPAFLNTISVDSKPISTTDAMMTECQSPEFGTQGPRPLLESSSELTIPKVRPSKLLINGVPSSLEEHKVEIKKFKVRRGFIKSGEDEQANEFNIQNNAKAIRLIHDKAFGKYKNEEAGKARGNSRSRSLQKFAKVVQKHVKGKSDSKSSIFSMMGKVKKARESPMQRFNKFLTPIFSCSKETVYNAKQTLQKFRVPFNPNGRVLLIWEIIMILLLFVDLTLLPFTIAFEDHVQEHIRTLDTIENIQLTLYFLNILVCFHSAFYKDGSLVYSRKEIARHYISRYFWIDIISSFPYRRVEGPYNSAVEFQPLHLLRLLRVLRIFRIFKSSKVLDIIEHKNMTNAVFMGVMNLLKMSVTISYLGHWCACGWYLLGTSYESSNSWMVDMELVEDSTQQKYVASLYFAITTMMTVGYGDITPVNLGERLFAIFTMLVGGGVFGYIMNSIAIIIQTLEGEKARKMKKVKGLINFMERKGLDENIKEEVKQYMKFSLENEDGSREGDKYLVSLLSTNLQEKISRAINGRFISESPLLQQIFTKDLKCSLSFYIEERIASPEEMIYARDGSDDAFYFISKGKVNLHYKGFMQTLAELGKGDYFGYIAFFSGRPHPLQAKSVEFSQLFYISREKFLQFLEKYPTDKQMFCMIKDKAILYKNYSDLKIKCYICEMTTHVTHDCPKLHYVPKEESVIKKYLQEQNSFRRNFTRQDRKRFNALTGVKVYEKIFPSIQESFDVRPSETDEHEEENEEENNDLTLKVRRTSLDMMTKQITLKTPTHNGPSHKGTLLFGDSIVLTKRYVLDRRNSGTVFVEVEENIVEEETIFDMVKNYEVYFPHNNISKILDQISLKKKKLDLSNESNVIRRTLQSLIESKRRSTYQEPYLLPPLGNVTEIARSFITNSLSISQIQTPTEAVPRKISAS